MYAAVLIERRMIGAGLVAFVLLGLGVSNLTTAVVVPRMLGRSNFNYDEMGELYMAMSFFGFALSAYAKTRPVLESVPAEEPVQAADRGGALAMRPFP